MKDGEEEVGIGYYSIKLENDMIKKIVLTFGLLFTINLLAQNSFNKLSIMKFEKIDLKNKIITLDKKTYKYDMQDEEDAYYVSSEATKSLKFLKKGEKVYVNIVYNKYNDREKSRQGKVNYIGIIPPPF